MIPQGRSIGYIVQAGDGHVLAGTAPLGILFPVKQDEIIGATIGVGKGIVVSKDESHKIIITIIDINCALDDDVDMLVRGHKKSGAAIDGLVHRAAAGLHLPV